MSNPLIEMSGLLGELKSDIDETLKEKTPLHRLKLFKIKKDELCHDENLKFPLIVKPDSGMRGTDVSLVYNRDELNKYLLKAKKDSVVQEYFPSKNEWGVFYYRFPNHKTGHVYSITHKEFPQVVGDGYSSVLNLLWKQPLVRVRFDWLYNSIKEKLSIIPEKGEVISLVERGSHSKGCLFLDGAHFLTPEIEASMTGILDSIDGFFIGRVDIRFENLEKLSKGEFKIIEINGTGGESSNYYDPQMPYLKVFQTLIGQWNLAFKIGDINKKRSVPQRKLIDFFKIILKYRKSDA